MPRIPPLPPDEWSGEVGRMLESVPLGAGGPLGEHNIFRTFARHPDLFRAWLRFGGQLLFRGLLPGRDRELLILRTAVLCGSSYEWGQHVRIGSEAGLQRAEIERVAQGPAAGWDEHDSALLHAAGELHESSRLRDATWAVLAKTYDEKQLMEVPALVGQYHLVAFMLNSFGVELDDGLEELPQ